MVVEYLQNEEQRNREMLTCLCCIDLLDKSKLFPIFSLRFP